MSERDYYPAGAYDDPRAPYNEHVNDVRPFDCTVTATLTKSMPIETDCYEEFRDNDEDGGWYSEISTFDTDWEEEYRAQYIDVDELLDMLADFIDAHIAPESLEPKDRRLMERLVSEARGWSLDEFEIERE